MIKTTSPNALLGLVVLLAGACATPDRSDGWAGDTETTASGATLVRNRAAGMWSDADRWTLTEDLRIGSMDGAGPDVFGNLMSLSLAVAEDGRMFVLDGQSSEVRVFDASGRHVRTFGRQGAGPGEMRSGYIAGWGPEGNLWITDAQVGRYAVFSREGDFITSHPRRIGFSMNPWPGMIDRSGRILDVGIRAGTPMEMVLVRVEPTTGAADTLPLPQYEGGQFRLLNAAGMPRMTTTIPFSGQLVWKLDPEGYVWSSVTDRYRVAQQTLEGDTVRIIDRVRESVPVTREERSAALRRLEGFVEAGGTIDPSRIPSTKPFLDDFVIDDRGNLWVVVPTAAGEMGYDVFDAEGRYLGLVDPPTPVFFRPVRPVFQGGMLYGFTTDELGVPYLVRLRIDDRDGS